jgi:hypothetical protein
MRQTYVRACVRACPHTKPLCVTSQKSVMPTVTIIRISNLTIISFLCLLTSKCVRIQFAQLTALKDAWMLHDSVYLEEWGLVGCDKVSLCKGVLTSDGINKHKGTTFHCNVNNYLPDDMTSHPTQHETSASFCINLKSWHLHLTQLCNIYGPYRFQMWPLHKFYQRITDVIIIKSRLLDSKIVRITNS